MTDRIDLELKDANAGCACCAPSEKTAVAPTSAVTTDVFVTGMTCAHCVASVTEELTEVEGVSGVDVDLHAGGVSRVTIHSSAPVDSAAVAAAVDEAGYALADAPA